MFPFTLGGGEDATTPNRDDLSTAEFIYGNGMGLTGVISGSVFEADSTTLLQGANVVARNTTDPFFGAVSTVSGYLYEPGGLGPGPTPAALEGSYDITGLTPGDDYTLEKVRVNKRFDGGSSVGPLEPPISFYFEEFYNGANEAATDPPDTPTLSVTITAIGGTVSSIDFICNAPPDILISAFPYFENFESFPLSLTSVGVDQTLPPAEGWINDISDDIDWRTDEGGTPSIGSGPFVDHTLGTVSGNYLYVESSGNGVGYPGQAAHLISPVFDFSTLSSPELRFFYHMFGSGMGDIHLDVSTNSGASYTNDFITAFTDNIDLWQEKAVDLSAYAGQSTFRFRIRGVTGSSFTSDMAIDDVTLQEVTPPTPLVFRIERTTGNVFAGGAFIGSGADLAERILVSESVEPGDVVELDPINPRHYRKARGSSQLIAGVITTQPGFTLGNNLDETKPTEVFAATRPMLALMGRVPVKATTENGPIRPGDLLTVSSEAGYAARCAGAKECVIIGKALEGLKEGEGMILVFVMVN